MNTKKFMIRLPTILAAVFMLVQISGLTAYAEKGLGVGNGDIRAIGFAVGLETAIFCCAYWIRQSVTNKNDKQDWRDVWARVAALIGLIVFMSISGFLNFAKSIQDLPIGYTELDKISAGVFGLSPTLFAALLGVMQGFIDRLPVAPSQHAPNEILLRVYAVAMNLVTLAEQRTSAQAVTDHAPAARIDAKPCPHCGEKQTNMGTHVRWHCKKRPGAGSE